MANVRDLLAIATGVGTGLAAARQQSRLEEQQEQTRNLLETGLEQFEADTDRLMELAPTPEAKEQASLLSARGRQGYMMAMSPNEQVATTGRALIESNAEALLNFGSELTTQATERAAAEAQLRKELGEQAWSRLNTLSDDITADSQEFISQRTAYERVTASAEDPSPAGDLSLLINYMKVLDPASVVREGELATAQNAGSVPERIRGMYNRVVSGERLTASQRQDFVSRAGRLYARAREQQAEINSRYMDRGRDGGVPENFLDTLAIPLGPTPFIGTVTTEDDTPTPAPSVREAGQETATVPAPPGARAVEELFSQSLINYLDTVAAEQGFEDYTIHEDGSVRSTTGERIALPRGRQQQIERAVRTGEFNAN